MITAEMDAPARVIPVYPARPEKIPGLATFLRMVRDNTIAVWPDFMFEATITERRTFRRRVLIAHHPDAIRHVLLDNAGNYARDRIGRRLLEPGLGKALLTLEGEAWRRHRRIMAPAFLPRRIDAFVPVIADVTRDLVREWDALPDGTEIDVSAAMTRLTLRIIARIMFSTEADGDAKTVGEAVTAYMELARPAIADLLGLPAWMAPRRRSAQATLAGMDRVIRAIIERRRRAPAAHDDLLALLLAARDEDGGGGLGDGELRDEVATVFSAGHETTANALSWAWYLLALAPDEADRLAAEASAVGGDPADAAALTRLPRTRMVFDETLRLYPAAHTIARAALGDDEIMGVRLRAGTEIIMSPWVMHRHRAFWPDPDRFDPENFSSAASAARPRFLYFPFGGGPRICIGAHLAITEALIILAMLTSRFRLHLVEDQCIDPVGLITLRPRHGIRMRIERRRS